MDMSVSRKHVDSLMRPYLQGLYDRCRRDADASHLDGLRSVLVDARVKAGAAQLLGLLKDDPFLIFSELHARSGVSKDFFPRCVEWLQDQGLVRVEEFHNRLTWKAMYLVLTVKAQDLIPVPRGKRVSPSHFRHSLYKQRLHAWLESGGWKASLEYGLASGGKVAGPDGRIDVYAVKGGVGVGYEVQLSLKKSDVVNNIRKCFGLFGVDRVCVVVERKPDFKKVKPFLDELPAEWRDRVDLMAVTEIPGKEG